MERGTLAVRVEDSRVDQIGQNGIQVIFKQVPISDFAAHLVEPKSVVDGLKEQISALIQLLTVVIQLSVCMKRDLNELLLLTGFVLLSFEPSLLTRPSHHTVAVGTKHFTQLMQCAKLADDLGGRFSGIVLVGFRDVKGLGILGFRRHNTHHNHLYLYYTTQY